MGCCGNNKPKWKREVVPDHKFDNVNLDDFYDPSCTTKTGYLFVFVVVFISFAQCVADLYTAVSLLVIGQTTVTPAIPTEYSKWVFFACIMVSFLLIIWDMFKAKRIIATHDISSAFTSVIANRYLSMTDYRYYCLFKSINANSKGIDNYAFFIFFTLKGWKRLLLAEAPRQVINIVTLEALVPEWLKIRNGSVSFNNEALGDSLVQKVLTCTMAFSVLVFSISFILVCVAVVLYIPLFCHIRGNLKEYCCHKVDKRITEILRKQRIKKNHRRAPEETDLFIKEASYKRPLLSGYNTENQFSSTTVNEKSTYFDAKDPSIANSTMLGTPSSQQRLLEDYQNEYVENYHLPSHISGNTFKDQNASVSQNYYSRPVAQQLPYQNRSYQFYAPSTLGQSTFPATAKPANAPSSTCANEQKYQQKKYPRGY